MADSIQRNVRVHCSIAHAFEVFTARVDLWWPVGHRKFEQSTLHLEAFSGGRFFERSTAGEESQLGDVLICDRPNSISYTWHPGKIDQPTHVLVTFVQDGEHTMVDVVHSEGDSALGEAWPDRVVLFKRGWERVLEGYCAYIERPD